EVLFGEYQQSNSYLTYIEQWRAQSFDAVVAGLEYAVPASNHIAEQLGLPHGGVNVSILSDKARLRDFCQSHQIAQPNYARVASYEDLAHFFHTFGKMVLKPTNRQASLGVVKINDANQLQSSWMEVQEIDEGVQLTERGMISSYLAETCVEGTEVSIEVFVRHNEMVWMNVTEKEITPGKYSVELAHVVPARLSVTMLESLKEFILQIVSAFQFENGVLHAEVIVDAQGPKLIEVAGRPPGDMIFKLIEHAYGFNPYAMYLAMLSKEDTHIPPPEKETVGACIRFLTFEPGEVDTFTGLDAFQHPNVTQWHLNEVKKIVPLTCSWDRIGYVMTVGQTAQEAYEIATEIDDSITYIKENRLCVKPF
ncbi:MAG: ATP-grasp domain-containing protein, partial [Bacilli bacterium]